MSDREQSSLREEVAIIGMAGRFPGAADVDEFWRNLCNGVESVRTFTAEELAGAFDVYDVEPLSPDDPLRGRANVVHTPHIDGRTRDANLRVADVIADDFARILRGEAPQAALTREAMRVRTEAAVPGTRA